MKSTEILKVRDGMMGFNTECYYIINGSDEFMKSQIKLGQRFIVRNEFQSRYQLYQSRDFRKGEIVKISSLKHSRSPDHLRLDIEKDVHYYVPVSWWIDRTFFINLIRRGKITFYNEEI